MAPPTSAGCSIALARRFEPAGFPSREPALATPLETIQSTREELPSRLRQGGSLIAPSGNDGTFLKVYKKSKDGGEPQRTPLRLRSVTCSRDSWSLPG